MKSSSKQLRKKGTRRGLTLLEVLVFMTVVSLVMGSVSAVIMQSLHSERAHEQRLIIFNYNRSYLEMLRAEDYNDLTDGFTAVGGEFVKIVNQNFLGDDAVHTITITEFNSAEFDDYVRVISEITWDTVLYGRTSSHIEESVIFLYPHAGT